MRKLHSFQESEDQAVKRLVGAVQSMLPGKNTKGNHELIEQYARMMWRNFYHHCDK